MSDTRRRRKSNNSGGSEDLSDSYDELNVTKETQSSGLTEARHDSEYDTAGSDSEADSQDGALRESGDGQEEDKPQKKLDDDEDRRNPQYIPKRGTFYEHDDRTTEDAPENTTETQNERDTKEKKVWKDKEDKWDHDRYNDDEQAPKSHEELIAVYGYDIRNEEGPPRARRRRRYGRGPNKYTRNWEDEDAYGKPAPNAAAGKGTPGKRLNRSGEEFPALGGNNKDDPEATEPEPVISSAWYSNKNKPQPKMQNFPPLQGQLDSQKTKPNNAINLQHTNENKAPNEPNNPAWKKETKSAQQGLSPNRNIGGGDADRSINNKTSPRDGNKRQVQESVSLAASRVRGRGFKANPNSSNAVANRTAESKPKGRGGGPISVDNRRNNAATHNDDQQLINDLKHMNVNEGAPFHQSGRQNKNFFPQSPGQPKPNTVPPRVQPQQPSPHQQTHQHQDPAGNRPKRYSSLRQRPALPEGPGQPGFQPPHGQHGYYPQAGNARGVIESQGFPQVPFEQSPAVAAPAAAMAGQPVIPLPPGGQGGNFAPPPFLVPPPQFMPPQTAPPSLINYVQGPSGPTFQPNFQGYQGYNPPVQPQGPPPPPELFQPQGCTYYSTAQQQQHAAPLRRPKAAIPILPPPDNQQQLLTSRGRGRTVQQQTILSPPPGGLQSQLEGKNDTGDSDQAATSGQFDSVESAKPAHVQQFQRDENADTATASLEDEGKNTTNLGIEKAAEPAGEVKVSLDVVVSKEAQTCIADEKDIVSPRGAEEPIVETKIDQGKAESAVLESPAVEEAAA